MFPNLSDISINSLLGSYLIKFQSFEFDQFQNTYFIVDEKLQSFIKTPTNKCLYITAKESNKTLSSVESIMVYLSDNGMTKNSNLVVIGGGFLQDVGTLVASLYMRGVSWIYVPTTLASMGDSCIGGKSSINAGSIKNLVGNFYPPSLVLIDPSFVTTLPNLEMVAGFSEIIKICFAHSKENFVKSTRLISDWEKKRDLESLSQVIDLSLKCKKHFVEEDEFDTGVRKLLNFGHSFGHALEVASNYGIPHGVAVLVGMLAASQHPLSESSETNAFLNQNCLALVRLIGTEILDEILAVDYEAFSRALEKDKKNSSLNLVLILPLNSGLKVIEIPFEDNALEVATNAMKSAIEMVINEIR